MPAPRNRDELFELIARAELADAETLRWAKAESGWINDEPPRLLQWLAGKKIITDLQAQRLLAGQFKGFWIGDWKIQEFIGEGFGRVYRAEHRTDKTNAALRVLPEGEWDDDRIAASQLELDALLALKHASFARFIECRSYGDLNVILTEFIQGWNVSGIVNSFGPIPWAAACHYIFHVAKAFEEAGRREVYSHHVSPDSVMIDNSGNVVSLGIGIQPLLDAYRPLSDADRSRLENNRAALPDKPTTTALNAAGPFTALGSQEVPVNYLPKSDVKTRRDEKLSEATIADPHASSAGLFRSSVQKLGRLLGYMLTGKWSATIEEITPMKLSWWLPKRLPSGFEANVPYDVKTVLRLMLADDRPDRMQTAGEVIGALQPFADSTAADNYFKYIHRDHCRYHCGKIYRSKYSVAATDMPPDTTGCVLGLMEPTTGQPPTGSRIATK